ncbi:MAG: hypothetical protein ACD_15C00016G0015 [uncultured bacterium]|nr:MAG: hypothetical protein ACD_15C00016G0015 [uncultured bacterium]
MDNKKISTSLGTVLIIIFSATALAFVLMYENKRRANEVKSDSMKVVENNKMENKKIDISNRWALVSHENFWNNPSLFAHKNYNFPNIEFSYPENWEFRCCGDMGHASEHFIYSSEYRDKSLPYIRITDYVLSGCPNSQSNCSLDKAIEISANEKFNRLKSNISKDQILPEKEIKKLNTKAFVFKKTEKEGNSSIAYLINLEDDIIQIDFVNYESLDENFINNFLDRMSLESK